MRLLDVYQNIKSEKDALKYVSQIILYQTDDGQTKLQVTMEDEIVQNVFKERELDEKAVCREFRRTGNDKSVIFSLEDK